MYDELGYVEGAKLDVSKLASGIFLWQKIEDGYMTPCYLYINEDKEKYIMDVEAFKRIQFEGIGNKTDNLIWVEMDTKDYEIKCFKLRGIK